MMDLLQRHFKLIIVWGLIIAILSVLVSLVLPKQYSAQSQVLIISRDRSGVDPYTQAKSAERIGEDLAQVMKTTDFYAKVMESTSANFNRARWQSLDERKQRKQWNKDVQGEMVYGSSLLNVVVYSDSKADALEFSKAVTETLSSRGWEYVGGDVAIKIVNDPMTSLWIVRPNILLNALIGFLAGIILSGAWVLKYKKHLFTI